MIGEHIRLRGVVQGVGFRITVERIALQHGLTGWVRNDGNDVLVALAGDAGSHGAFLAALLSDLPPHARVDQVERTPADIAPTGDFTIAPTRR